jgi:hypothetical protein
LIAVIDNQPLKLRKRFGISLQVSRNTALDTLPPQAYSWYATYTAMLSENDLEYIEDVKDILTNMQVDLNRVYSLQSSPSAGQTCSECASAKTWIPSNEYMNGGFACTNYGCESSVNQKDHIARTEILLSDRA